jgi:glycosyltransferase involved in cell wall biosynthesis
MQSGGGSISVVVCVFNEEDNVLPLLERILAVLRPLGRPFEVIFVDDGSTDQTRPRLTAAAATTPELVLVKLRRNFGQTLALQAGFDRARGDVILTMDGDLQNDPADIPRLLERIAEGADVVSGWRVNRQDAMVLRKLPSWVANRMIQRATKVPIHDQGCSLKAYRREVIERLSLYSDMHRFVAVLTMPTGARIDEIPVHHHARIHGESKYGISRVFKVMVDLLVIQMLTRFRESPSRWFALLGLPFLIGSILTAVWALWLGDEGNVASVVSIELGLVFVSCLFAGIFGEGVIDSSGRAKVPRLGVRELGGKR